MAESEDFNKTPEELYRQIVQKNDLAHVKTGEMRKEACGACKSALDEIIRRKDGITSDTFGAMVENDEGVGSEACDDICKYARVLTGGGSGTEALQKKYKTYYRGCAMSGIWPAVQIETQHK